MHHCTVLVGLLCVIQSVCQVVPPKGVTDLFSAQGCGEVRTCFREPAGCLAPTGKDACNGFASWWPTEDEEDTNFALYGATSATGYVAVGISRTPGMLDTDVYACTTDSELIRYYNDPQKLKFESTEFRPLIGVSNQEVTSDEGVVKCSFSRRQKTGPDGDASLFDLSDDNVYFSLVVVGSSLNDDGNITFHDVTSIGSGEAVSFSKVESVNVDQTALRMKKAHGMMMVIAWVAFAAIGITFARFFKPQWSDATLCGTKVWFAVHRAYMSCVLMLVSAAFIIIFVEKRNFVRQEEGTKLFWHAIIGTLNMTLVLLNVILAIFRPHPGTSKRLYFNWAHRTIGLSAFTSALVCITLAVNANEPFLSLPDSSSFWVMVAFIAAHIMVWTVLQVYDCRDGKHSEDKTQGIDMSKSGGPPDAESQQRSSRFKTIVLVIQIVVIIFTVGWLTSKIGLATR